MDSQPIELDVRSIPPWDRHARILATFDALAPGAELHLTSDHEPRPLRAQFEELRAGQYVWLQRMIAGGEWRMTLRRVSTHRADDSMLAFLRRCAIFADVCEQSLRLLADAASERVLLRDEAVVEEASTWDGFGLVMSGTLTAVRTSPYGREHGIYDVLPTEAFGEVSLLDGGVALARFAAATQRTTVALIPKPVMLEAMRLEPSLMRSLGVISVQRTRAILERFSAQATLPTVARVASVLLPHAGPEPGLQPALTSLEHVTQSQMAVAAGTVKEVVSRALMELEHAGAIERRAGRIARVDREKLTSFAASL